MGINMKDVALILTNMNKLNAKKVAQIAAKLGWLKPKMPAKVVLDAVWTMVCNYINTTADVCDIKVTEEQALDHMLKVEDTNKLYLYLFIEDTMTLNDWCYHKAALNLRSEVEAMLVDGYTIAEAKKEWDL